MNLGYLIEHCRYYTRNVARKKCGCDSCKTAIHNAERSEWLRRNHTPGRYCKQRNNCPECGETKWKLRIINHIAFDGSKCTRMCEVCRGEAYPSMLYWTKNNIPKTLYKLMLPRK